MNIDFTPVSSVASSVARATAPVLRAAAAEAGKAAVQSVVAVTVTVACYGALYAGWRAFEKWTNARADQAPAPATPAVLQAVPPMADAA